MMSSSSIIRPFDTLIQSNRFRLVRYGIAGVAVSLGYTFTMVALVSWTGMLGPGAANVMSVILWTIISYTAHREFTFQFNGEYGGSGARFIFVSVLKLGVSVAVITTITRYYEAWYLIGVAINWVALPLVSYIALKLWVFRRNPTGEAPAALARSTAAGRRLNWIWSRTGRTRTAGAGAKASTRLLPQRWLD